MKNAVAWILKNSLALTLLLMAGCGGGGGNAGSGNTPSDGVPPVQTAPGGLYVGYFQEDPFGNPEDPEAGALVLSLPEKDGALSGSINFTYLDCQSFNTGTLAGNKSGTVIAGNWAAAVDNSSQSGAYSGTYDASNGSYLGVISNFNGKQFKNVAGCLQHYLAASGSWAAFPVEKNQPSGFALTIQANSVLWTTGTDTVTALVYLLDSARALAGNGNSVVSQTLVSQRQSSVSFATSGLIKGKEYIAVVMLSNGNSVRTAFASKRFIAS